MGVVGVGVRAGPRLADGGRRLGSARRCPRWASMGGVAGGRGLLGAAMGAMSRAAATACTRRGRGMRRLSDAAFAGLTKVGHVKTGVQAKRSTQERQRSHARLFIPRGEPGASGFGTPPADCSACEREAEQRKRTGFGYDGRRGKLDVVDRQGVL